VFVQIGTQLEQARIQEVRDIPVIAVIDPPLEPTKKASPRIRNIVIAALVVGCVAALAAAIFDVVRDQFERSL
jgi:uncharacterized protein involved in exopolysaccharide biosynthesis